MNDAVNRPTQLRIIMTSRTGEAPGLTACLTGWFLGMMNIVLMLESELDPCQQQLLMDLFQCWGRVIPHTLSQSHRPRIVLPEEAGTISKLFEQAYTTATIVRIFRTILPHQAVNRERDDAIVKELREFCAEKSDEIERLSRIGAFEAEQWIFERLCWHLRQLPLVILGDDLHRRFEAEYEVQMRDLLQMVQLASAPLQ
jgi:hypothetical protein